MRFAWIFHVKVVPRNGTAAKTIVIECELMIKKTSIVPFPTECMILEFPFRCRFRYFKHYFNQSKFQQFIFRDVLYFMSFDFIEFISVEDDGSCSSWGAWGSCLGTCGPGQRKRYRKCSCSGTFEQTQNCNLDACPGESASCYNKTQCA